jgi:hypothetical protein
VTLIEGRGVRAGPGGHTEQQLRAALRERHWHDDALVVGPNICRGVFVSWTKRFPPPGPRSHSVDGCGTTAAVALTIALAAAIRKDDDEQRWR